MASQERWRGALELFVVFVMRAREVVVPCVLSAGFKCATVLVQQERTVTALQLRLRCVCGEFGEKAVTESGGSG